MQIEILGAAFGAIEKETHKGRYRRIDRISSHVAGVTTTTANTTQKKDFPLNHLDLDSFARD
jgi:hypothetical protein